MPSVQISRTVPVIMSEFPLSIVHYLHKHSPGLYLPHCPITIIPALLSHSHPILIGNNHSLLHILCFCIGSECMIIHTYYHVHKAWLCLSLIYTLNFHHLAILNHRGCPSLLPISSYLKPKVVINSPNNQ